MAPPAETEGILPPCASVEESQCVQKGENTRRHLITNLHIWKMDHSLTLATSKVLHKLTSEAERALEILFVIIRAGWVQSGQLICLRSHTKYVLQSECLRISDTSSLKWKPKWIDYKD